MDDALDIDELARKIEDRIKELEKNAIKKEEKLEYNPKTTKKNLLELDEIIKEIDRRIDELEEEKKKDNVSLNLDKLTKKINNRLETISNDDNLSKIANSINDNLKNIEEKRKKKKQQKAKYCDLARKRAKGLKNKK